MDRVADPIHSASSQDSSPASFQEFSARSSFGNKTRNCTKLHDFEFARSCRGCLCEAGPILESLLSFHQVQKGLMYESKFLIDQPESRANLNGSIFF